MSSVVPYLFKEPPRCMLYFAFYLVSIGLMQTSVCNLLISIKCGLKLMNE
jgi:hypothetical protein